MFLIDPDTDLAIWTWGLGKRYGYVEALGSLDLSIPRGTVCRLLGPKSPREQCEILCPVPDPSGLPPNL